MIWRPRPGVPHTADVAAHDILSQILVSLLGHLAGGQRDRLVPLGDCWRARSGARRGPSRDGWVPFHKLSQWLTYSLLEPFEWAGVKVRGVDAADRACPSTATAAC